jgi:hypothetical protein
MKEILVNSISNISYTIYVDGVATAATGDVHVTVLRNGIKVVDNVVATSVNDATGKYKYLLPISVVVDDEPVSVVDTEGILQATWTFTVDSTTLAVTEYYDVVTPYSSWDYFLGELGENISYKTYLECERVARHIINSHCGQEFGQEYTTYAVEGHGTNSLALPRRLQTLDKVTWVSNPIPRPGDAIGSGAEYAWETVGEGWTIRQQPYPHDLNLVHTHKDRFIRNRTYNVSGLWGWPGIPTEVEEASKILTADFMCKEAKYRDKYLDNIKMGDWRIQFTAGAFIGTGNVKADQLLRDYVLTPGIGLI